MKPAPLPEAPYRPISRRRRLLILVLAIGTAVVVVLAMLGPQLRKTRAVYERKVAGPQPCAAQLPHGWVGGPMGVIAAPGAAAASR